MADVILRPWKYDDAEALVGIANNKNIWNNVRDRLPSPYTINDAKDWIAFTVLQNPKTNFAVAYNGVLAGSAGCILKDDINRRSIEIGYFIGEDFWGKGIATEAVKLIAAYAVKEFNPVRMYAEVFENNKASMRVLQKNGFYLEAIHRRSVIKNKVVMDDYVWVKLL
jgi:RimJ/RimL family protein N-acetyltransferase